MSMPLSMVKEGEINTICKVGGKEETRKFLEKSWFCIRRRGNSSIPDQWQHYC